MEQQETLGILWDKGNEEEGEKVCPNCGMPLYGKDAYCMGCGMTVAPMDKKEYENRKAGEAAGGRNRRRDGKLWQHRQVWESNGQ